MNDRDRQTGYERSQQQGGYAGSQSGGSSQGDYGSPRQANQWQADSAGQHGGDWRQDSGQRAGDDYARDYRFSGQDRDAHSYDRQQPTGRGSDEWLGADQREAARNYQQGRERQRPYGGRDQDQRGAAYTGQSYDASGGNDFGSFTSNDYGGRDFSNRGGISGGARSSESYRPSYGLSSWSRRSQDDDHDYGSWRQYGESRGFLAKASDEVASWFGSEDATRRRENDHREDHSGRGPSGYTRSDERIREDANDRLTHDASVDATHITVSVEGGEVTLSGTVNSRSAKRRAEDVVDGISGVKHVQNNLRVQDARSSGNQGWSNGDPSSSAAAQSNQSATNPSATSQASSGQSGSATTSGVGSSATSGVIGASGSRANEKTS